MVFKKPKKQELNVIALALTLGLLSAACMLIMGVAWWQFDVWPVTSQIVSEWYVGYGPTGVGTVVGMLYGFVDGFIGGAVVAWLYNKLAASKYCK
jgi:hypothetical protein